MLLYLVIIFAIVTRFLPHQVNLGMVTALAIFAGTYLPKKQAIAIPFVVRFVSDIFLGFFSWPLMVAVYASHLVGVLFGFWIKRSEGTWSRTLKVVSSGLGSALLFFFVTNSAFLYAPEQYAHTWDGVMLAYTNGLPFLRGTLIGDVGYTVVFFGAFSLVKYFKSKKEIVLVRV